MITHANNRLLLCDVPVDPTTPEELANSIIEWSSRKLRPGERPKHISYVNAHVHNLARSNQQLRSALQNTSLCYADGASIVWACRKKGEAMPPRLTAADFLPDILQTLSAANRRVFLLGSAPGTIPAAVTQLQASIDFQPVGIRDGYFPIEQTQQLLDEIHASNADVLIVGMGSPRQELWVHEHLDAIQVPVVWTVGALFDYFAGTERRCPRWMGDRGLEWLYRLMMQPTRMAGRYLVGNPQFVAAAMTGKLTRVTAAGSCESQ